MENCKVCGSAKDLIKVRDEEEKIVWICETCYESVCEGYEKIDEPEKRCKMKKIYLASLLAVSALFFSSNVAFANCGVCGVGEKNPTHSPQEVSSPTIKGEVICLGCTLKKEQGAKAQCSVYGHTNGLKTSDGNIWTFLENDNSTTLINDHSLAGKKIEIKGKIYENANYIEVESYKIKE